MRKVTYICNRCRKPIMGTLVKILALDINRDNNVATFSKDKYPEMMGRDFCEDCAELFRKMLTEACKTNEPTVEEMVERAGELLTKHGKAIAKTPDFEAAVEETIASQQEKIATAQKTNTGATSHKNGGEVEKRSKKRLDVGKIHALRKAGWPVSKIADEMDCSEASVYNALKKEPKTMDEGPEEEE